MDDVVVFIAVFALGLAADDLRQFLQLNDIAVFLRRKFNRVVTRLEAAYSLFDVEFQHKRLAVEAFQRLQFAPTARSRQPQMAFVRIRNLPTACADAGRRMGIFQNSHRVVDGRFRQFRRVFQEGMDFRRFAKQRHDIVDKMAAEIEHDAAFHLREILLVNFAAVAVVHVHINREDIAESVVAYHVLHEFEHRVAAEHVSHLQWEIFRLAAVKQFLVQREIRSRWLVKMHGKTMFHDAHRNRNQFQIRHFHKHGVQIRNVEHLFLRQTRSIFEERRIVAKTRRLAPRCFIDDAHELIRARHFLKRHEFPVRMLMADSVLYDFQFFHGFPLKCSFYMVM